MILTLNLRPDVTAIAVQVPPDSENFELGSPGIDESCLWFSVDNDPDWVELPPGEYEIVGLMREITPEVADTLVARKMMVFYHNYIDPHQYWDNPLDSLKSAFLAKGYDFAEQNWLILKKK